jgi:uridine kinase
VDRGELLAHLANRVAGLHLGRRIRVGIDGVDGVGKTFLADELAPVVTALGRPVIRASVDGFHHPAAVRHRRGRDSPDGFYLDSYDYERLRTELLDPLAPEEDGRYRVRVFDVGADASVLSEVESAPADAVLLFDGIFLHRPELRSYWDLSIFLQVDFAVSIPRGAQRGPDFGSADPAAESNRRYVSGQTRYLAEARPDARATVVIDNTNLTNPIILR